MRLALAVTLALAAVAVQADPRLARDWPKTDFSCAVMDLPEVISGGPRKNGIPAIDRPRHIAVARETRAWPVRCLMWHEFVNDTPGGVPAAFCPLVQHRAGV